MYSIYSDTQGKDVVAIGNILANHLITDAMVEAFEAATGQPLESRLVSALEAGREAGGEILEPLHSAALQVSGPDGMERVDLRIDNAPEAVAALRQLLTAYGDQEAHLRRVAFSPDDVPVARSMFDASVSRIEELELENRFPTASNKDSWTLAG